MTDTQTELTDDEPSTNQDPADTPVDDEGDGAADGDGIRVQKGDPGRPLDYGVKLRAKVKRGTGTRDQDELLIEGRGKDADAAAADFEAALTKAEEHDWADRLRALQPGGGDDDE